MYGAGPLYGAVVVLLTAAGVALTQTGRMPVIEYGRFYIPLAIAGAALLIAGACLWYSAVFCVRIDDHIKSNTLVTIGVYAWVRNPIYSAFLLACTGTLLLADNLWLLVLPPIYWLYLTILMKCTEEKWLAALHGQAYAAYCRRVNRCIPWFPGKTENREI